MENAVEEEMMSHMKIQVMNATFNLWKGPIGNEESSERLGELLSDALKYKKKEIKEQLEEEPE